MTDATAAAAQDTTAATATTAQSDTTLLTSGADANTATAATADASTTTTTDATNQEGDQAAKDKAVADAAKAKDQSQGAPEAYTDFTLPEGMELDADVLGEFTAFAKELNLPQDKAQKIVDFQTKLATKQAEEYQAAAAKQGEEWAAQVKNDPELGGANYDKSVASAVKVIQSFGDEGLRELLNGSGLGNHPALFKFCHRISQAISEDKFVLPGSQSSTGRKSNEEVFYGGSKS